MEAVYQFPQLRIGETVGERLHTEGESTPNEDPRIKGHGSKVPISGSPGNVCDIWVCCEGRNEAVN